MSAISAPSILTSSTISGRVRDKGREAIDLYHAQLALGNVGNLDLLDSDSLAGAPIEGLVDGSESALADTIAEPLLL